MSNISGKQGRCPVYCLGSQAGELLSWEHSDICAGIR